MSGFTSARENNHHPKKTTNFLTVKFNKALCLMNDGVCRYIIIRRRNSVTCRIAGDLLTGDDYLLNVAIIYG